jgi:(1->4)-alpha-D-glucan 1-alpha-D-glucosylmutase
MTTLSTHDTKRAEDVRARLFILSEIVDEWREQVDHWRGGTSSYRPEILDANTEYLLWQTLVGAWPIDAGRLAAYLEKATREAKRYTTWTEPNAAYDGALRAFVERVLADQPVLDSVESFVRRLAPAFRVNVLGQKLVQLTMPGVPDLYQGCELVDLSLVDPDNRRPVDYETRRVRLSRVTGGGTPMDLDDEKLRVVTSALHLRRQHPEWFGPQSSYDPVPVNSNHALAFVRGGQALTLLSLPPGVWYDALSGGRWQGRARLDALLAELPVALLVQADP